MSQPTAQAAPPNPVIYARYLLAADRSPLNFESEEWDKYVGDVALYGDSGIQLCLKTLAEMRPAWHEALLSIARNRNANWRKDETPVQSVDRVRYGFTAIVNQLNMRGHIAVPPLYKLDMSVLERGRGNQGGRLEEKEHATDGRVVQ
jgi:hypothetical protein